MLAEDHVPVIDPSVKHIGISKLRGLNASKLRGATHTFVIQENDTPLAVLVNYEKFLIMQEQLSSVLNTLELVWNQAEVAGVLEGLKDLKENRVRSLAEIRADLENQGDK